MACGGGEPALDRGADVLVLEGGECTLLWCVLGAAFAAAAAQPVSFGLCVAVDMSERRYVRCGTVRPALLDQSELGYIVFFFHLI